jgi:t-SNARE complex subunit (syntaxin)
VRAAAARSPAPRADEHARADHIDTNIHSVADDTHAAANELTTASAYQRKAGRRAACLMVILGVVVCVVLLAVRSSVWRS